MRYQESRQDDKNPLDNILATINIVLFIVIAVCFHYLYVNFLF